MIQFQPLSYIESLVGQNKLCREKGFRIVHCSGPDNIEGIMAEYRDTENFIVIDDTTDNAIHGGRAGYFTHAVYTVWVIAATDYNDPEGRHEALELCREIFRQMLSRMLLDRESYKYDGMEYMAFDRVMYKELGRYSFNGATGLYFMLDNDRPTDLTYKADQWSSQT